MTAGRGCPPLGRATEPARRFHLLARGKEPCEQLHSRWERSFRHLAWQWERKERFDEDFACLSFRIVVFTLFFPCLRVCLSVYLLFLNMTQQVFHVFVLCALLWFALLFVCFALLWFVFCFFFALLCSVLLFLDLTHGVSHVLRSLCFALFCFSLT